MKSQLFITTCLLSLLMLGCKKDEVTPDSKIGSANTVSNNSAALKIGDYTAGGMIFYLDATGQHGLVCTLNDYIVPFNPSTWSGYDSIPGASSYAIGAGQANTTAIVNYVGSGNYAASVCDLLVINGYSDWYLPSADELNAMGANLVMNHLGNFYTAADLYYFSSTQYHYGSFSTYITMLINYTTNVTPYMMVEGPMGSLINLRVRPIRSF